MGSGRAIPATPMTADEAVRQAETEGLMLLESDNNATGYKGVHSLLPRCKKKPYKADVQRGGKTVFLGYFVRSDIDVHTRPYLALI